MDRAVSNAAACADSLWRPATATGMARPALQRCSPTEGAGTLIRPRSASQLTASATVNACALAAVRSKVVSPAAGLRASKGPRFVHTDDAFARARAEAARDLTRRPRTADANSLAPSTQRSLQGAAVASGPADEHAERVAFGALRELGCLRPLADESLRRLVRQGVPRRFARYQALYAEGAPAVSLYVLLTGGVGCTTAADTAGGRHESPVAVVGLEALAELATPLPAARLESALAEVHSTCLVFSRDQLRAMLRGHTAG